MAAINIGGIARILIQQGALTEDAAAKIQEKAKASNITFIAQALSDKALSSGDIAKKVSKALSLPYIDISAINTEHLPKNIIDSKKLEQHRIIPLQVRGKNLFIATSDPTNIHSLDSLQFQSGLALMPIVVDDVHLSRVLKAIIDATSATSIDVADGDYGEMDFGESEAEADDAPGNEVDDAPVVKFIQKTLIDAINLGASDLHFEPYEKFYRIRYRIDGILSEMARPPLAIKDKIASRIKVISGMNIAEKRVPQDGRMRLMVTKTRAIDFRVSTLPTLQGEKIVMRILDPSSATLGIEALGYEPEQKAALLEAISRPYGMVLVTGPTGSGKTVSLYTCLNILNSDGINISTAEDPAEINLPGINQVNVNDKAGLTFSVALKSFLRQDPDIIMIGEIRDLETADMAIKAASTGHMVLSTLHTNDAPQTLTRLMNMGVAPFNIASAVNMITAQRLARRLCKSCKVPVVVPKDTLLKVGFTPEQLDEKWTLYGPKEGGCDACNGNGYKGRVGIYQVMPISDEMSRIIMNNGTAIDIADQAQKDGVKDLRQSGLIKVMSGATSIEEVEGCTNETK